MFLCRLHIQLAAPLPIEIGWLGIVEGTVTSDIMKAKLLVLKGEDGVQKNGCQLRTLHLNRC
jgi:hypothetical protein